MSPCQKSVWLLGNVNTPAVSNNITLLDSVMQYHKSNNVRYKNAGQTLYESVLSSEDQLFIQRQRQNAAVLLSLLERQQEVGLQRLPALKDNKRACGWNRWKSIDSPKSTSVEPLNIQAASKIVGLNFWTVPSTEIAIKKKNKQKTALCLFWRFSYSCKSKFKKHSGS